MGRLTRTQLLIGDCKTARELGLSDGKEGRAIEPGQVPRNVRGEYLRGHARGTVQRANADSDYATAS
jgi:hypothetical protein